MRTYGRPIATKRWSRAAALACSAGLALVLGSPSSAQADTGGGFGATVTPFSVTSQDNFQGALPECFDPGLVGTNIATDTVTGQIVQTPSGVLTVQGTDVFTYRVDFPNGMYAFGSGASHFSFVNTGKVTVFTQSGQEPRTVYAADGTPVVHVVIHFGTHFTFRDLNGDGIPQPNEFSSSVDRFFFTCH